MTASTKRIVVLGKTGAGKSSLANTIFGKAVFETDDSPNSGTSTCKAVTICVDGRNIMWIDTPGFFDTKRPEEELKREIARCIVECAPGPHVFVIVLKVEKFTEQEQAVVKELQKCFTEEAFKYTIVLFTHGDQLSEETKIEQWVDQNADLRALVEKCGSRCHVFDNKYWANGKQDRSNRFQAGELLNTIDKMIEANKGSCYTHEMLQACERHIEEEHSKLSSVNMSEEERKAQAKLIVLKRFLTVMAGVTSGTLLCLFLGEKKNEGLTVALGLFLGKNLAIYVS